MTGILRLAVANCPLHIIHNHQSQLIYPRYQRKNKSLIARSKSWSRCAPAHLGLRRPTAASLSLVQGRACHHRRRSASSFNNLNLYQKRRDMASNHEIRRRYSAAVRATSCDAPLSPVSAMAMSTTFSPIPDSALAQVKDGQILQQQQQQPPPPLAAVLDGGNHVLSIQPPTPTPTPQPLGTVPSGARLRRARAESMAACSPRHANRLSLTLPIAPCCREDAAHPPLSAGPPSVTLSSIPPTPAQTPVLPALEDANDFIIAIAAQERRVLELREELARAEADLTSLKAQWSSDGSMHRRAAEIQSLSRASPQHCSTPESLMSSPRQSLDLDRKKLWLQSQQNNCPTPIQGRRRVMRGGHARALSLLSLTRSDAALDLGQAKGNVDASMAIAEPLHERKAPSLSRQGPVSKRATWQPRSQPQQTGGIQFVEDLKTGLRTFVEDIRQITVGDEPITGVPAQRHSATPPTRNLGAALQDRPNSTPKARECKSSLAGRGRANSTLDSIKQSPMLNGKADDVISMPEKAKSSSKGKQFSWTPLGLETLEDDDWTSWGSPSSTKSSRWSGSTIHNAGMDEIQTTAEKEEATTPLKTQRPSQSNVIHNKRLDDFLPSMVNRLSPSNLKRTANNLMDEWEKSLVAPETKTGTEDKEN